MTRLSLHDRKGEKTERKLPLCKMCCQLFASDDSGLNGSDRRIAAFRPCGHVFHYSCIMARYQKQEDNCVCPTCYARFEDLPVILFMEWSKSARPMSLEETENIRLVNAPDEQAINLREQLAILSLKLDGLREQKGRIIQELNEFSDSAAIARSKCDGLDELCQILEERISSAQTTTAREEKVCEELHCRIERDRNKGTIIEFASMVDAQQPEAKLSDFVVRHLGSSADPDGLLANLSTLYAHYHKKVKDSTQTLAQLKTTVNLVRKDTEQAEHRLLAVQRAKQTKKPTQKVVKPLAPIDRKVVPTKSRPMAGSHDHDELGIASKRSRANNYNFFT